MKWLWRSKVVRVLLAVAVTVAMTVGILFGAFFYLDYAIGGGDPEPMSQEQIEKAESAMAKLPPLEQARAELDRRVVGVTDIIHRFVPSLTFTWDNGNNLHAGRSLRR